jgi:hypothetical protein
VIGSTYGNSASFGLATQPCKFTSPRSCDWTVGTYLKNGTLTISNYSKFHLVSLLPTRAPRSETHRLGRLPLLSAHLPRSSCFRILSPRTRRLPGTRPSVVLSDLLRRAHHVHQPHCHHHWLHLLVCAGTSNSLAAVAGGAEHRGAGHPGCRFRCCGALLAPENDNTPGILGYVATAELHHLVSAGWLGSR